MKANCRTSGLGELICLKFAAEGANIAINYKSSVDRAKALQKRIWQEHGVTTFIIQGVSLVFFWGGNGQMHLRYCVGIQRSLGNDPNRTWVSKQTVSDL